MIQELWSAFPSLIVQKINALLEEAEPNPARAYLIYKTCQRENLWEGSFEGFARHLRSFFSLSRGERKKSIFDHYLHRPMGQDVYANFHLTFRSALVNNMTLLEIASWAHHLVRVGYKTTCPVASEDVFTKTLNYITNPPHFEKDENIEFEDFCAAWSKTVSQIFGRAYEHEFAALLKEARWQHQQMKESEMAVQESGFFPTIYLTQTEIDWTTAVRRAAFQYETIPKFPLSRGPQKQRLCELYGTIGLYRLVQKADSPEFFQHREKLRQKILDQCDSLLRERAR